MDKYVIQMGPASYGFDAWAMERIPEDDISLGGRPTEIGF